MTETVVKNFLKSLLTYPTALVGGLVVLALRVVGWFLLLGSTLMGIFWFFGELDVNGWTLAITVIVGLISLLFDDCVMRLAGKEG